MLQLILIFTSWNFLNKTFSIQFCIYFILIIYLLYWYFSIFFFILKKSYLGKFSSIIQRFWKRTLMLFWSIEMFLFFIYLFLICNNSEESLYVLDNSKILKQLLVSITEILEKTYLYLYLLLFLFLFIKIKKFSIKIYFLFFFICLNFIFIAETYQLLFFQSYFNNYLYQWDQKKKTWLMIQDYLKSRPFYLYLYVLIFLKYWHVLFIYCYVIVNYWYLKIYSNSSFNVISSIYINYFYLFVFNYFFMYMYLKKFSKYIISLEYTELHVNQNFYYCFEVVFMSFNLYLFYLF